jgi:hypothetical protein
MRSSIQLATALAAALLLAACGTQTTSSTSTAPAASTGSVTSTTVTKTVTQTPTSGTTSAAGNVCRAGDLALRFLGQQGATGHGELGFVVRNTSGSTCTTGGYPGVQFTSRSGALLPTATHRTTSDFFGHSPLASVTLAPGQEASCRLGVTHGVTSTAHCTTAFGLRVYPPGDTSTLRVAITGGGAYECATATVSPMRDGTSAYP